MRRPGPWLRQFLMTALALVFTSSTTWAANENNASKIANRMAASAKVLYDIMATPDKAIPDGVTKRAICIAVFPSTIQVAVLVGAKHGKGIVTCRTAKGWSALAPVSITGGSWGPSWVARSSPRATARVT